MKFPDDLGKLRCHLEKRSFPVTEYSLHMDERPRRRSKVARERLERE